MRRGGGVGKFLEALDSRTERPAEKFVNIGVARFCKDFASYHAAVGKPDLPNRGDVMRGPVDVGSHQDCQPHRFQTHLIHPVSSCIAPAVPVGFFTHLASLIPYLVGAILGVAAVLKALQLLTEPQSNDASLFPPWSPILLIQIELVCSLALLLGIRPVQTRRACFCLFSIFICVSTIGVIFGAKTCACFGNGAAGTIVGNAS